MGEALSTRPGTWTGVGDAKLARALGNAGAPCPFHVRGHDVSLVERDAADCR